MKTFLLSILSLAVAAGPVLGAQDEDQIRQQAKKQQTRAPQQQHVNVVPRTVTPRVQHNTPVTTNRVYTPRVYTPNNLQTRTRTFNPQNQDAPKPINRVQTDTALAKNNWQARTWNRNNPNAFTPQTNTTVQSNTIRRNQFDRDDHRSKDRNWNNNNQNWRNNPSGVFTFDQARRNFHRDRHDRSWWRSRYNRIVLFGGGYYYWNNNYWYPAYGYDPYYSTYTYDEPIYGYNDLAPGQVIANVQTALQEQGYYNDAVDGLIGPNTRAALSNFQRDRGLPITAAIDGPTLQALGLY
jgi:hypothetical protein